jgi:hypothetical protein
MFLNKSLLLKRRNCYSHVKYYNEDDNWHTSDMNGDATVQCIMGFHV